MPLGVLKKLWAPGDTRNSANNQVAKPETEAHLIERVLAYVQASERQRVRRTLNHVKKRSEKGNYIFSDAEYISESTRQSDDPDNLDSEITHLNTLDTASKAAKEAGVDRELADYLARYQAVFLQRRIAEEAEATGETAQELLDWIQQQPYLVQKFEIAASHCTKEREEREKKLGFWGRMKARWQRFREDLHDDLEAPRLRVKPGNNHDWISVMSRVIRRINAKTQRGEWRSICEGQEPLRGKHFLIALQEEFPALSLSQAIYIPADEIAESSQRNEYHPPLRDALYEWGRSAV